MKAHGPRVTFALGGVELASLERPAVARIVQARRHLGHGETGELREEVAASFLHQPGQLRGVVGEVEPRRRGAELLSLEQQMFLGGPAPAHSYPLSLHEAR